RYVDAGPPPLKAFVERSGMTMNVGGVQEQRVQPVRPTLLMLQGGVAFLLLTSIGAALGLGVAWGALRVTNFYLAKMLPQSLPASLDWRVLGFAIALALAIGLLIGLIPVLHIVRTNLAAVIQSSSRGSSSSRGVRALSSTLVVAQVGVALMLLTGAGLSHDE